MVMSVDISRLPIPSRPRNSEKPGESVVAPDTHSDATVEPDPSKSSSSTTTSGTQALVGAAVGAELGLPGLTVGPAVVGAALVGLAVVGVALGLPGVTVGPEVVGATVLGVA